MENVWDQVRNLPLFEGVSEALLPCLQGYVRTYRKGEVLLHEGDPALWIGIVLEGCVQISRSDYDGNRHILTEVEAGGLFAEAFACAGRAELPVSVTAETAVRALFLSCERLLTPCTQGCGEHHRLIRNLVRLLAQKNERLNRKIELLSCRTTREKLMTYLEGEARRAGCRRFDIPYDRQELADYLGVERSAMSAELGRMQREGLLTTRRRHFCLPAGQESGE